MSHPAPPAGPMPTSWAPPPATAAPSAPPVSASALLFANEAEVDKALAAPATDPAAAKRKEQVDKLHKSAKKVAEKQIRNAMEEVLGVRFSDVVFRAWQKHAALLAAAKRTATGKPEKETVSLAMHTIKSVHQPSITITINGLDAGTINLKLTLMLKIQGAVAVIERGHLKAIESGAITASASLAVNNSPPTTKTTTLDAVTTLHLAKPYPLVRDLPVVAPAPLPTPEPVGPPSALPPPQGPPA